MISQRDLDWLAGLLEGEGCFMLVTSTSKSHKRYPVIRLKMVDKDIVERAASIMNTIVQKPVDLPSGKIAYNCSVQGLVAIPLLKLLYPLMGMRRKEKIDFILSNTDEISTYLSEVRRNQSKHKLTADRQK